MGNLPKWSEMFPTGRNLFYEGKTPQTFVEEMKHKYGFDPSRGGDNGLWNKENGYQFRCPVSCIDEIYGNGKYPLGS